MISIGYDSAGRAYDFEACHDYQTGCNSYLERGIVHPKSTNAGGKNDCKQGDRIQQIRLDFITLEKSEIEEVSCREQGQNTDIRVRGPARPEGACNRDG